jgi:diguanylate cyclase (GGDEF)-like protein
VKQAPAILAVILACSAILSVYLSAFAQYRKRIPGAKEFGFLALTCALYSAGYAIEISRLDLPGMLMAIRVEYLGIAGMPTLFLLLAIRLQRARSPEFRLVAWLLLIPLATLLLVWTSGYHSFYYKDPHVEALGSYAVFKFTRGPCYAASAVYQTLVMISGFGILLVRSITASGKKRRQAVALAIGASLPILNACFYLFGINPAGVDSGPIALTLSCLIYGFALFKLGLFDLLPAARAIALDSINEGFLVIDQKGRLQDMNRAARSLPALASAKEGEPLPSGSPLADCIAALVESENGSRELSLPDSEGVTRRYEAKSYPVLENRAALRGTAILMSDITERSLLLEQLDTLARTDCLTGLLNRRSLLELGAKEIERSRRSRLPLGVLLADLDFFKSINDRYGHDAGDEALKAVSSRFNTILRSVDIFGRYGGEEFVAFLPGADMESSLAAAERLRDAIESSEIAYGDMEIKITASIGVHSQVAEESTRLESCLIHADMALYRAKESGRNRVCAFAISPRG